MTNEYDVIIIGSGVVGSAVARELSRYKLKIAVLEKELDVCTQTSGRNTGMLHAGFTYKTGSLKAICSVEGNAEFDIVAKELDVPFKRTGKLIIGFDERDMESLLRFKARGEANGVPGLEIIDRARMDQLDPSAGGNFAMYAPTSGILDPFIYTIALAENACNNGAEYFFDHEVTGVERNPKGWHTVKTPKGSFHSRWVVNSAGLCSAHISRMLGMGDYTIGGFKGEYFVLDKKAGAFAKIPIYPAPNKNGTFDTHATPTIDGNVLVGPDSLLVKEMDNYDSTASAMEGLIKDGKKMFAHMKREYFIRNFTGTRPKLIDPDTREVLDFKLETREDVPNVVNLVGIESPGLTCALPLARRVAKIITSKDTPPLNADFNPIRKGIVRFGEQDEEGRRRLIEENPDYGEIVCRCENVTRAEILQAIHNPLGVHTVNGIKYRTRASMGRCQGGYCETRITTMLRQELNLQENEVLLSDAASNMFTGRVR